jgi:hypothetical protein
MHIPGLVLALTAFTSGLLASPALAQPARTVTEAECQALRTRAAEHAKVSEGVRRLLAGLAPAPAVPAATPAPAPPPAADRGAAIRARLEQIPGERQRLEEQRLGAVVQFNLSRAAQIQAQMQALDEERARLEREQASLPAAGAPAAPAPAPAAAKPATGVDAIRCQDMPGAVEAAVKTRQKELGAKEGQAGAVPLLPLRGQDRDQITRELAAQLAAWPAAAGQVGLLDQDADGRLDGFVDVPAEGVYRLVRQRADGSVGLEVFSLPAAAAAYGDLTRRLEETAVRQGQRTLADLLAHRPAGAVAVLAETREFAAARAAYLSSAWADAAKADGGAARTREFENVRGEKVRELELIGPAAGGVAVRQVVTVARGGQELVEETTTVIRPVSYWRTDVEVGARRETRAPGGSAGQPVASPPVRFSLER